MVWEGLGPGGWVTLARPPAARSIEYWFRLMDLDGDGALSMFELEHFYEEQSRRLDCMGIEALPFQDCLCQMLDLVKPQSPGPPGAGGTPCGGGTPPVGPHVRGTLCGVPWGNALCEGTHVRGGHRIGMP